MSERTAQVNFVHDVNNMRHNLKQVAKTSKDVKSGIPEYGGIQVLPVLWRQKVEFDTGSGGKKDTKKATDGANREIHINDITLPGVQSIRTLVSDVILDSIIFIYV